MGKRTGEEQRGRIRSCCAEEVEAAGSFDGVRCGKVVDRDCRREMKQTGREAGSEVAASLSNGHPKIDV